MRFVDVAAVQKGASAKLKTSAQDRLAKIVKKVPTAVDDMLKESLLESIDKCVLRTKEILPHASVNSHKPFAVASTTGSNGIKSARAIRIVDSAKSVGTAQIGWTNHFARDEGIGKAEAIPIDAKKSALFSSFCPPTNELQTRLTTHIMKKGHDTQAQNRFKMNDNSKIIGGR